MVVAAYALPDAGAVGEGEAGDCPLTRHETEMPSWVVGVLEALRGGGAWLLFWRRTGEPATSTLDCDGSSCATLRGEFWADMRPSVMGGGLPVMALCKATTASRSRVASLTCNGAGECQWLRVRHWTMTASYLPSQLLDDVLLVS